MATLFADTFDAAPSPGFFKDSYQPDDDDTNLFDQAFSTPSANDDPKVSSAEAYDLGILPTTTVPHSKPTYPYPSLTFGGPAGPYQTGEPTPPASNQNSPTSWPLDVENPTFGRSSGAEMLPSLRTDGLLRHAPLDFMPMDLGQHTPPDDEARMDFSPLPPDHAAPEHDLAGPKRSRKSKNFSNAQSQPKKTATTATPSRPRKDGKPAKPRNRKTPAKASPDSSAASKEEEGAEELDPKRSIFLERNRVAAFKCRQKKKEQTARMEAECRELARKKGARLLELEALNKEYFRLKSILLEHAQTGCERAQGHVQRLLEQDRQKGDLAREMLLTLQGNSRGGGASGEDKAAVKAEPEDDGEDDGMMEDDAEMELA